MFSCEISQIFKNTFFTEHLRWLLLEGVCEGTSLVKILQSCHLIYLKSITDVLERCPLREIMNNRDCWNVYRFSCLVYKWLELNSKIFRELPMINYKLSLSRAYWYALVIQLFWNQDCGTMRVRYRVEVTVVR